MTKNRKALLITAATAAFLIKVCLAFFTIGTNDMVTFESMIVKLQTRGTVVLYAEGTDVTITGEKIGMIQMNHPPFSLNLLTAWGAMEKVTRWPVRFWMRLTCALADLLTVWLLWRLGLDFWAIFVLAISPGTIMVSGFHGNTDPIM